MYCTFYNTNDVFSAEEIFNKNNIECSIVPTPVQDIAYCGVSVEVELSEDEIENYLRGFEYKTF